MLSKRIIACLDVKDGRTVKGVQFEGLVDAGDAVELGQKYSEQGIDELVFLDITATLENRNTFIELVSRVASNVQIPFTVGGGIKCLEDIERLLRAGADKISLNTAALNNPSLISSASVEFGSQCIVVAIDSKQIATNHTVFKNAGKTQTDWETLSWSNEVYNLGAGEILLTSIDKDGSKQGFNLELTKLISESVSIPVIASGGAGKIQDFVDVFKVGLADAALAASIFHYGEVKIQDLKRDLNKSAIQVRL